MRQRTIKDQIFISGKGIHTGLNTNLTLKPEKEGYGIKFKRTDLNPPVIIEASLSNVFDTQRSTSLKKNGAVVHTVEHILAAITALKIDNILIELDNCEIPILDGSSEKFLRLIRNVGVRKQEIKKEFIDIDESIEFSGENGEKYLIEPSNNFSINVIIDYQSEILQKQKATLENIDNFDKEIAKCRTFCFVHELRMLHKKGLVKGGSLDNAIVILDREIEKDELNDICSLLKKEPIHLKELGVVNGTKLYYENEPARHKLLDAIGDFALLGKNIKGKISITKPGHTYNIKFAKKIQRIMLQKSKNIAPNIDLNKEPMYDKEKIKQILPHRDPFLFIDEIRDLGEDFIVGVKYVHGSEDYFKGHFPGHPVMPGVLQLETMAQVGGILILETVPDPENYLTYFMKIDNAKFKQKVTPGDTIIYHLHLISPIRRGLCHMHGKGFVNDQVVVEADLLAQIAKK